MNSKSPNKQEGGEFDKQGRKEVENTRVGSHIFNISLDSTWFLVLNLTFFF